MSGISCQKSERAIYIDNNRIFTISELAKDIISKSNGGSTIPEIIDHIKEKYQIPHYEANPNVRVPEW